MGRFNRSVLASLMLCTVVGVQSGRVAAETGLGPGDSLTFDFGTVWSAPTPETFMFTNTDAPVDMGASSIGGGFEVVQDLCDGATLATGASCAVVVGVDMTSPLGPNAGTLTIRDTAASSLATVDLSYVRTDGIFAGYGGVWNLTLTTPRSFTPADSTLVVSGDENGVEFTLRDGSFRYEVEIAPPLGEVLAPDTTYLDTTGDRGETAKLRSTVSSSACSDSPGEFTVSELQVDGDGQILLIEVFFVLSCLREPDVGVLRYLRTPGAVGAILGPTNVDLGEALVGDAQGSVIVANGSEVPVGLATDTADLEEMSLDDSACGSEVSARSMCLLTVDLPQGSSPETVTESFGVDLGATHHDLVATGRRETFFLAAMADESPRWPRLTVASHRLGLSSLTSPFYSNRSEPSISIHYAIPDWGTGELDITVPEGEVLGPGRYTNLGVRSHGYWALDPVIDIHEVTTDGPEITSLSADIAASCRDDCEVTFVVRYNSEIDTAMVVPSIYEYDFGDVYVEDPYVGFYLTNFGDRPAELDRVLFDPAGAYRLVGDGCDGTVAPLESCVQFVEFVGARGGPLIHHATLHVSPVGGTGSTSIAFEGLDYRFHPPDSGESGYWVLQRDGTITAFGDAQPFDLPAHEGSMIQMVSSPSGRGALVLDDQGNVFALGDARSLGSLSDAHRSTFEPGERVVTMSMSPTGWGYWIFTTRGRVFRFGDAGDVGDLLGFDLAGEIIDSVAAPSGDGVYMIGTDGGVFALGGARFAGSVPQVLPGVTLDQPIVGIVPDPDGDGYWLVAADGGVFGFSAPFRGSLPGALAPGAQLVSPVNGMVPFGNGYLLVAGDGGVFNFSDQPFDGSIGGSVLESPVVSITSFA